MVALAELDAMEATVGLGAEECRLLAIVAARRRGGVILSADEVRALADAYARMPPEHVAALGAAYDLMRRVAARGAGTHDAQCRRYPPLPTPTRRQLP